MEKGKYDAELKLHYDGGKSSVKIGGLEIGGLISEINITHVVRQLPILTLEMVIVDGITIDFNGGIAIGDTQIEDGLARVIYDQLKARFGEVK